MPHVWLYAELVNDVTVIVHLSLTAGIQSPLSGSMTARGSPSSGSMTARGTPRGLRTEPAGFGYGNNSPSGSMTARGSFGNTPPSGSMTARGKQLECDCMSCIHLHQLLIQALEVSLYSCTRAAVKMEVLGLWLSVQLHALLHLQPRQMQPGATMQFATNLQP